MFLAPNLRFLRLQRGLTQEGLAHALGISRGQVKSYEGDQAQPPLAVLLALGDFFGATLDDLVRRDLEAAGHTPAADVRGTALRVLATTVGMDNRENVELVPVKAAAGYCGGGFADPGFIETLPTFRLPLPGISPDRKYRLFQLEGESMLPVPDGSWVLGEYVRDWTAVRERQACVVVTTSQPVFKLVENRLGREGRLLLHSLNPTVRSYALPAEEVRELWRFKLYLTDALPEGATMLETVHSDVKLIKKLLLEQGQAAGLTP